MVTATDSRREQIITSAAGLLYERGAAATSMRDIGKATGILGGSLYHYFSSKDEIIDEVIRRSTDELDVLYGQALKANKTPLAQLEAIIAASFTVVERHPAAVRLYFDDHKYLASRENFGYLGDLTKKHQRLWLRIVRRGMREGALRSDVDAERFARIARDAIFSTARWWIRLEAGTSEAALRDFTTILLNGIVSR